MQQHVMGEAATAFRSGQTTHNASLIRAACMVSGYARLGSVIRHHMSGGLIIIQLNMFLAIYHHSSQHVRVWMTCHYSERYTKKDEWLTDHHHTEW